MAIHCRAAKNSLRGTTLNSPNVLWLSDLQDIEVSFVLVSFEHPGQRVCHSSLKRQDLRPLVLPFIDARTGPHALKQRQHLLCFWRCPNKKILSPRHTREELQMSY